MGSSGGKQKKTKSSLGRVILPALILLAAVIYLVADPDVSVETILAFTPDDPLLAAAILLLLYGLKSATIVFPLMLLELTSGHLFPTGQALLVNLMGLAILMTVPYLIGRWSGMEAVDRLIQKYPRFGAVLDRQKESSLFLCFFLRVIGCLPGDVVTMYLGATGTPFGKNLLGGILGLLPRMVLATILGSSIQDPSSPTFWVSALLTVLLSVTSAAGYYFYRRRLDGGQGKAPPPAAE